jgi:hypothetical protein
MSSLTVASPSLKEYLEISRSSSVRICLVNFNIQIPRKPGFPCRRRHKRCMLLEQDAKLRKFCLWRKCGCQKCLNLLLVVHLITRYIRTWVQKTWQMPYLASGCNRTCGTATSVVGILSFVMLCFTTSGVDTWTNVSPSAVVQRLLLWPCQCQKPLSTLYDAAYLTPEQIGIRILIKMRGDLGRVKICSAMISSGAILVLTISYGNGESCSIRLIATSLIALSSLSWRRVKYTCPTTRTIAVNVQHRYHFRY